MAAAVFRLPILFNPPESPVMYSTLIRPLLFKLDPEQAHNLTIQTLAHAYCLMPRVNPHTKPTSLMGLQLPNPVGLAAGLDKTAKRLTAWRRWVLVLLKSHGNSRAPQEGNPTATPVSRARASGDCEPHGL